MKRCEACLRASTCEFPATPITSSDLSTQMYEMMSGRLRLLDFFQSRDQQTHNSTSINTDKTWQSSLLLRGFRNPGRCRDCYPRLEWQVCSGRQASSFQGARASYKRQSRAEFWTRCSGTSMLTSLLDNIQQMIIDKFLGCILVLVP